MSCRLEDRINGIDGVITGVNGWIVLVTVVMATTGCTAPRFAADAPPPDDLAIIMRSWSTDGRYTYFLAKKSGVLHFGGGQNALANHADPFTTLTTEQRTDLWRIILNHDLLRAKASSTDPPRHVRWRLSLTAAGFGRTLKCADDDVAGVGKLHDNLMRIWKNSHARRIGIEDDIMDRY